MSNEEKALRTIPFDGKTSSYMNWRERFLSLCTIKGCASVLLTDYDENTLVAEGTALNTTNDADGKQKEFRTQNRLAYAMLMLSQSDNVTLTALKASITTKLPNDDARGAWKNLEKLHKPTDYATKYELINKFNHLELRNDNKNPDEWFAELESLRSQLTIDFSYKIEDDKMISHIIYNLHPKIYQTLLTMIKRDINNKKVPTLEELKKDIRLVYLQNYNIQATAKKG